MEVKFAHDELSIIKCWNVLKELRQNINMNGYIELIKEMINEGYQLAYIEENGIAVSAIGFRYLQFLNIGKHFYIDDLSTLPDYRGKGYAGKLLDHVIQLAKDKGFNVVALDSGHQRYNAHRLYLNKGFVIASHHFVRKILDDEKI